MPTTCMQEASRIVAHAALKLNPLTPITTLSPEETAELQGAAGPFSGEMECWADDALPSDAESALVVAANCHGPVKPTRGVNRQDTGVCRHWARGFCAMGESCAFPHEGPSPAPSSSVVVVNGQSADSLPSREELRRKKMFVVVKSSEHCKDYNAGKCTRGDKCKFAHVGSIRGSQSPSDNNQRAPGGMSNRIEQHQQGIRCRDWRAGRCNRGTACKYIHDEDVRDDDYGRDYGYETAPPPQMQPAMNGGVAQGRTVIRRTFYTTAPPPQQHPVITYQPPPQQQQYATLVSVPPMIQQPDNGSYGYAPMPQQQLIGPPPTTTVGHTEVPTPMTPPMVQHTEPPMPPQPYLEGEGTLPRDDDGSNLVSPMLSQQGHPVQDCSSAVQSPTAPHTPATPTSAPVLDRSAEELRAQLAEAEAEAARLRWQAAEAQARATRLRAEATDEPEHMHLQTMQSHQMQEDKNVHGQPHHDSKYVDYNCVQSYTNPPMPEQCFAPDPGYYCHGDYSTVATA